MKKVIGIIGPIGAGKDVAGDYLAGKLNIKTAAISSSLKIVCERNSIEPSRENLIKLGAELAKKHGEGYLAEILLKDAPAISIITGMRQPGQITYLRTNAELILVAIDASPEIRFERIRKNNKLGEADTLEEFISRELAENSPPNPQRVFECIKQVDYRITNESSLDSFLTKLDILAGKLSF